MKKHWFLVLIVLCVVAIMACDIAGTILELKLRREWRRRLDALEERVGALEQGRAQGQPVQGADE